MTTAANYDTLPDNLPVPIDDGACDHLPGMPLPSVALTSTRGEQIDVSKLPGRVVIYIYPRTGSPGEPLPDGWDEIPGARGCTPQSCSFRDHFQELQQLGASVFGMSVQDTEYQREAADRLHLPFTLLSDVQMKFTHALRLPTFEVAEMMLNKRVTLISRSNVIEKVFYPVFPPDVNAGNVLSWLKANPL